MQQTTTQMYGATIVNVDPTQGIIEAVTKAGRISISVYFIDTSFQWPVVGESWMVCKKNGTWYLEGRYPKTDVYHQIDPGDALITAPTGIVRVTSDGSDNDYELMRPGRIIIESAFVGDKWGDNTWGDSNTWGSVPLGFVMCDGAAYSRNEYASLFQAIGTIHGEGDGSTTFNVPNIPSPAPQIFYYIKT